MPDTSFPFPGLSMRPVRVAVLLAALAVAAPFQAWAQSSTTQVQLLERVESLEESIKDIRRVLEEDVRVLLQSAERQGGLSGQDLADLNNQIGNLSDQVATLSNRLERTLSVASDNEFRLLRLEKRIDSLVRVGLGQSLAETGPAGPVGTGAGEVPSSSLNTRDNQETLWSIDDQTLTRELSGGDLEPGENVDGNGNLELAAVDSIGGSQSVLPDSDPDEQYKFALGKALQNDLGTAEQAFNEFISSNPGHGLEADASFWLGRVQFMRGSYEKAVQTFSDFQTQWPDDARIEKTTLWIGESVVNFASQDDACELLALLPSQVPEPTESFDERLAKLKTTAGCPE